MRIMLVLLFCLGSRFSYSGPALATSTSIIVQFSRTMHENELHELSAFQFTAIKPLNSEKTLWKFSFAAGMETFQAIELIRKVPFYTLHQLDGPIAFRSSSPNDSFFTSQYHLPLIRATEAWDLQRNGINKRGDTLVIAVIDDGLHVNHPDFQGNIWINYADTAGNGIDDDNNGYIDDHYGWNFMGQNNDISDSNYYKAGHGTPVAGIIGAKGNNKTGVAGILWQVKLMIVNFTDTGRFPAVFQSDVIKAYSYVLQQRKLYNQTNGKQGAYVVATNSSWGADNKFPHQAPLWCSMYDSLGKYGIINVSAVSNNPQNQVDVDGDLPTLCPSIHLVTVSSTTSNDNFFSSGYSPVSVDLSAPGANIYTTAAYTPVNIAQNRVYRNGYSGTSFACPMVTGAAGLLYAYACERILDTMRMNPAKGNELIRQFILNGVDVIDGLGGKSVSSGRLNIKNSMVLMDQYCYGYVGLEEKETSAKLILFPNPGNGQIELISDVAIEEIKLFTSDGKQIDLHYTEGKIDISLLPGGLYFVQVKTEKGTLNLKYLKTE